MQSDRKEFESMRSEFLEYLKKQTVPPKMKSKLLFLSRRVRGETIKPDELAELQQDEIDQLEQLTEANKINLFLSVTRCVMGKEDLEFVNKKQAFVKKQAMFSFWNVCYITYDSNSITITKKKPVELLLKNLQISSKVRKGNTKWSFGLHAPQGKYRIGFTNEKIAKDVHKKFKQLILGVSEGETNQIMQTSQSEQPSKYQEGGDVANMDVMAEIEQEKYGQGILEQYEALKLEDDSEYKLQKHIDSGRILRHISKPNTFKVIVLIDIPSAESVLNLYAQGKEWNTELADSSIITRIDDYTYICYEKYKAYSFSSWARDFVVVKSGLQHLNQIYLLQKSVQHQDHPPTSMMVRGNLVRKATVFLNKQNGSGTLMITRIEIDFAGRNSKEDNRNMAIQYLSSYDKFPKYCIEKSFTNTAQRLFSFKKGKTIRRQSQQMHILPKELTSTPQKQQVNQVQPHQPEPKIKKPFASLLQKYIDDDIPQELFERLKIGEQNYHYLKHRYDMEPIAEGKRYQAPGKDDFVFQGGNWVVNDNNDMVFVNQKAIDAQKDVIKYILKQIGTNLLAGKSVMNMSLPVEIFDSRSILERSSASMGYVPSLFLPASKIPNEVQQMYAVITHMMSLTLLELRIEKPFNPILGETFQGFLAGIPIYMEQISHHPPISYVLMKCKQFTLYGNIIINVEMGLNSATGNNTGIVHIVFQNGTHFEYIMPEGEISGLIYGDRKFKLVNKGFVFQRNKNLYCQVFVGKEKQIYGLNKKKLGGCQFTGGIWKVTTEFMGKFLAEKKKSKWAGITKKDVVQHLVTVEGDWNGDILFNGKVYKKLYEPNPHKLEYETYPLASNSNYREDILYRRLGNLAQSQISKEVLQNLQRTDRKLRGSKH